MSLGLDPLLAALRHAGLPVGIAEVARLREVFALAPELVGPPGTPSPRLRAVLRAVLIKSAEDRDLFDGVFDAWFSRAEMELNFLTAAPSAEKREVPEESRRASRLLWRALAPALLTLLCLALGGHLKMPPVYEVPLPVMPPKKIVSPPSPFTPAIPARTPAEIRKQSFMAWVPTLTVTPASPWRGWVPLALGVLALLSGGGLWFALRRRRWFPAPAPPPVKKGPPRVFLPPPQLAGAQLLAPREQEALVWGIGQFVAEEPTRRLDLAATVRDTARAGGVPHVRFHRARYPREVWLWIDEAVDDPALQRLASEVETALQGYGLPVERALFRGIPDWLVNTSGQSFAPNEVDERRDAALVAILTDGRLLAGQYAAADLRVPLDGLLRSLSHWPRLAFVDFALGPGEMAGLLARHSLERIAPGELAAFLGSDEAMRRQAAAAGTADDAAWAAACALAPASIDEARAFELRRRLGLTVSPWVLRALRAEAPGPPGRLQWRPVDRSRRVNWLREAEAHPAGGVAAGSLLGEALTFWEDAYDGELNGWGAAGAGAWWQGTPAHQHLTMERALLSLWRDAPHAVRELYQLFCGALHDAVERHLGSLAPLDWGRQDHLHLSWPWSARSGAEQVMLQEMGFGGGMPLATLERPGRLWLGLGLCLGLAAGALGAAARSGPLPSKGPPKVVHDKKPAEALPDVVRGSGRNWIVTVATEKLLTAENTDAGARVAVQWKEQSVPCVAPLSGGAEAWRCGGVANPPYARERSRRRVITLVTSVRNPEAEELAVHLLDTGSADVVQIGPSWRQFQDRIADSLVLPESRWGDLSQALRFDGTRTVAQVWPKTALLAGDPRAVLSGCRAGETIEEDGVVFVHICPGTFTMGSDDRDGQAYDDEKPAHKVTLSEYWIGKYEMADWQVRHIPADQGQLPATRINWREAEAFCQLHGWRLPTEAEWEYAARAGTETAWSFGDDEKALRDYAWFEGNAGGEAHPVGTKYPNPWGIHDMHGNAWEWVADRWGPYQPGLQTNPTGPSTGERRVLRGGAFGDSPRYLRSADRGRVLPWIRFRNFGFRCARGPRRQASPP